MRPPCTVLIFLKAPRMGEVKTRLARVLGDAEARNVYRTLAEGQVARVPRSWHRQVRFTPDAAGNEMQRWLGAELDYQPQGEGDLGKRLHAGVLQAFASGASRVLAIGGDCPTLDRACLTSACDALARVDVVLGPACDGGYYLIGLRRPVPELFEKISWGTSVVCEQTLRRIDACSLTCELLETREDVDDIASWQRWIAGRSGRLEPRLIDPAEELPA